MKWIDFKKKKRGTSILQKSSETFTLQNKQRETITLWHLFSKFYSSPARATLSNFVEVKGVFRNFHGAVERVRHVSYSRG